MRDGGGTPAREGGGGTPPAIRDNVQEEMGVNVKIVTLKNILGINVETFLDW